MIEEHEEFILFDKDKRNNITAEVNWNPDNEKTNKCQIIRFKMGKKEALISKKELNALLFVIGKRNEQRKMVPMKITNVRHYKTTVSIMATRDVRKGEIIRGPVTITLPAVSEEVIGAVAKEVKQGKPNEHNIDKMIEEFREKSKKEANQSKIIKIDETKQGIKGDSGDSGEEA